MARGVCVVALPLWLRSKQKQIFVKDGQWFYSGVQPAPILLPMQSKCKALKSNKVTRLCVFLGLIFLWDEHPHHACASASLESFHWKRPLSIIMASLGRAVSEWRGFYFDNSLWAVWSSYEGKYSTTFQASERCFKTGFFPPLFFYFFQKHPKFKRQCGRTL